MGNLPVGHHCFGQNAVHIQTAAHSCQDELQHTQTLCYLLNHNNNTAWYKKFHPLILSPLPFHSWSNAEWTSHWVWEPPSVFQPAHWFVTPPTGCARRPKWSNQSHPIRSTRLHGNRSQRARLRRTWQEFSLCKAHIILFHVKSQIQSLWFSGCFRVSSKRLTIDIDKSSNLVLVVWETADFSHWHRRISRNCKPVNHCKDQEIQIHLSHAVSF